MGSRIGRIGMDVINRGTSFFGCYFFSGRPPTGCVAMGIDVSTLPRLLSSADKPNNGSGFQVSCYDIQPRYMKLEVSGQGLTQPKIVHSCYSIIQDFSDSLGSHDAIPNVTAQWWEFTCKLRIKIVQRNTSPEYSKPLHLFICYW